METTLHNWLGTQKDIEEYSFRFLKNGELTHELNFFFELKNRIPVALTAIGGIIYAEVFDTETLFSVFYPDQSLDFHVAASIDGFEKLLEGTSPAFFWHIACCGSSPYETRIKKTNLNELEEVLGPLQKSEIYGYTDDDFTKHASASSVSHWLSPRDIPKAAIQNAQDYFNKTVSLFEKKLSTYSKNLYINVYNNNASEFFFLGGSDIDRDILRSGRMGIKRIYHCFGTDKLANLRSIHTCSTDYLQHTRHLNYFKHSSSFMGKIVNSFLPLLQHNKELLRIVIQDEIEYRPDYFETKGALTSFEALAAFPLLRSFKVVNVGIPHFPEELTQLPNLDAVCLIKTDTQRLPASLANMAALRQLHFAHCPLASQLTPVFSLTALTALTLHNCGLTHVQEGLQQLTQLEELDLSGNALGEIPQWIGSLTNLKTLNLSNCGLATLPDSIGNLKNITGFEAKGNAFTTLPKTLLNLKNKIALEPRFKALYDEKVRKKLEKDGMKPAVFIDINFKLMVIQSLMYDKGLLLPKFDVYEFAKNYTARTIDPESEGYDMIPEALTFFEQLEIPIILLDEVEEMDGGMDVYHEISPMWGGEDDYYIVKSVKDAKMLRNLKRIQFDFDVKKVLLSQLEKMNIEAE